MDYLPPIKNMDAVDGYYYHNQAKRLKKEKKYLNVAQNNTAAKTIAALLSNGTARERKGFSDRTKIYEFDATVMGENSKMVMISVTGHLMEYRFEGECDRRWDVVDHLELFDERIHKTYKRYTNNIIQNLKQEIRDCDGLIIWTYCTPEGENIGFEIIDLCKSRKPNIMVKRAIFSEITAPTLERALQNLTEPDENKSASVDVRMEVDLRSGAALTRLQTMRLQQRFPQLEGMVISYGSCLLPILGILFKRYEHYQNFKKPLYGGIKVTHTIQELTMEFLWNRRSSEVFHYEKSYNNYFQKVRSKRTATVETVTEVTTSWKRPHPLNTVELIKLASRKLMLTAEEVMTAADNLYERGIISYPYTDTNIFSYGFDLRTSVKQQAKHNVWGPFARLVANWGPQPNNGDKSDLFHPPIYPTKMVNDLDGIEAQVYELICRHFLACLSKDAEVIETIVTIKIADETFTAKGFEISESSYLDIYIYDKFKKIHKFKRREQFQPTEISMINGQTTVSPYLTEADLLASMAEYGIGTCNTNINHIKTLKHEGYVEVIDKFYLKPSSLGWALHRNYKSIITALEDPFFTIDFKRDLREICLGTRNADEVLREQIEKYKKIYDKYFPEKRGSYYVNRSY